ncbi:MAG: 6-bladed beta-propeller [Candidatus Saccharicenans sp.]|nr:6-bladed beta-propeller [Candidatus Saccharicenans sp.]MDH7492346.1 6-bladed beta-propeller [Candidatus Saccharicenans sp.]
MERIIPLVEDKGLAQSEDQNYLFNYPSGLDVCFESVFVLDTMNDRIQVFDLQGSFKHSIGQRGKGPGEFNSPEGFFVEVETRKMYVADTRNLRLQVLDLAGKEIITMNLRFAPAGVVARKERIYLLAFPGSSLVLKKEPLIKTFGADLQPGEGLLEPIKTNDLLMNMMANSILLKKDRQGNLVCARQFGLNQVLVFDERNRLSRSFEILYKGSNLAKPGVDLKLKSDQDVQKVAFIVADLAFDSRNNYYFLAGLSGLQADGQPEKSREIYKYDQKGNYLGTIILPDQARLIAFGPDDSLFLVDGNFQLRKFKIRGGRRQ